MQWAVLVALAMVLVGGLAWAEDGSVPWPVAVSVEDASPFQLQCGCGYDLIDCKCVWRWWGYHLCCIYICCYGFWCNICDYRIQCYPGCDWPEIPMIIEEVAER